MCLFFLRIREKTLSQNSFSLASSSSNLKASNIVSTLPTSFQHCRHRFNTAEGQTLMLLESVRNIVSLSTPRPQPAVGGRPYSRAVQKFSSTNMASSSPAALSCKKPKTRTRNNKTHCHLLLLCATRTKVHVSVYLLRDRSLPFFNPFSLTLYKTATLLFITYISSWSLPFFESFLVDLVTIRQPSILFKMAT